MTFKASLLEASSECSNVSPVDVICYSVVGVSFSRDRSKDIVASLDRVAISLKSDNSGGLRVRVFCETDFVVVVVVKKFSDDFAWNLETKARSTDVYI